MSCLKALIGYLLHFEPYRSIKMVRIYQTPDVKTADIRIALISSQSEADLCVFRVNSWGLAVGDALWFVCPHRQDAQCSLYFGNPEMAHVSVCFVDSQSAAGWKRPHRLKGRFGR